MLRIRGTVGDLPVDLTIEMDPADWALLGNQLNILAPSDAPTPTPTSKPKNQDDALWRNALALVESSGQISGPSLLEQLEGLAGSTAGAKRLLVRLRHSALIQVQSGADAPLYCWAG
ncbi:hypothetical protein [Pseudomonas sp. MWU16-30317]|uniref:hypothetical protein n=1 Tax=Pseudomonas sp. MWU16-30317 TaxID=2878095 RepID=UPI001CFB990B|nr:hypothetical protein [Pseudomonas sp. MWU16-30317]